MAGESQHLGPSRCVCCSSPGLSPPPRIRKPFEALLPLWAGHEGRFLLGFVASFLAGSRCSLWDFQVPPALQQVPSPLPADMAQTWHTLVHVQPLGQGLEPLFMLLVALRCQGCHEKQTQTASPGHRTRCWAQWDAEAARAALLSPSIGGFGSSD